MRKACFALAFATVVASAFGQNLKVERYTLPNGLTVILNEDHRLPNVAVNLWYRVGSKDEAPRRSGFAHLFEHLMFMGTDRAPNGYFDSVMEAAGGSNNASTWYDWTNYFESGPSRLLSTFLWLEADRMQMLGKAMTKEKLDLQRDVVRNERRERVENPPYGVAENLISELIYPEGHPYHIEVIGRHEDLEAATVDDVKNFFSTFYVPNNCSLVVAGDFDPKEAKKLIASYFGALPRQSDPYHRDAAPARFDSVKRMTLVDKAPAPRVYMVWHSPAASSIGDLRMGVAANILGDGVSGRLYRALVAEKNLASEVRVGQTPLVLGSQFQITITANPGASLDEIEAVADQVLSDFKKNGPTADEVTRQTAKLQTSLARSIESISERADRLNEYQFYLGDPNSFEKMLKMYQSITAKGVQETAKQVIDLDRRLVLRVVGKEEVSAQASPLDTKPSLNSPKPFTFPTPTTFGLPNGVTVHVYPRPDVPLVSVQATFNLSANHEPVGKKGITNLLSQAMERGAGKLSAIEFEAAQERLGANIGAAAGGNGMAFSMSVLSNNLAPATELFRDMILAPRFDEKEMATLLSEAREGIKTDEASPGYAIDTLLRGALFGDSVSQSLPVVGTSTTLKKITSADIREWYKAVGTTGFKIYVSGNVTPEQVRDLFGKAFGKWATRGVPGPEDPAGVSEKNQFVMIDNPGAAQTIVRVAFPQPRLPEVQSENLSKSEANPDRLIRELITTILGGSFTSRLNQNLREKNGFTYGAGFSLFQTRSYGYGTVRTGVRTEVTGPAFKEILSELKRISSGDITQAELDKAISLRRNDGIESLATLSSWVNVLAGLGLQGLAQNMKELESRGFDNITLDQVNAVAKTMFPLDKATFAIVGDKDKVLPQLKGLGLPEVVVKGTLPK